MSLLRKHSITYSLRGQSDVIQALLIIWVTKQIHFIPNIWELSFGIQPQPISGDNHLQAYGFRTMQDLSNFHEVQASWGFLTHGFLWAVKRIGEHLIWSMI